MNLKSIISIFSVILAGLLFVKSGQFIYAAELGNKPLVGAVYNTSLVVKKKLLSKLKLSINLGKDAALFTVGGLSLDAYILTLPLSPDVKTRVIKRLSNPYYAIPLGHFLYMFYDRYAGFDDVDVFKRHLLTVYDKSLLNQYQHSLLNFNEADGELSGDQKSNAALDNSLVAAIITIYDVLFNNDEWLLAKNLPDHYVYLTNSSEDRALVGRVQAILIDVLDGYSKTMEPGEFKSAIELILIDARPEHAGKVNNKAQAITVTLVDFIRLNVLKSYRQFALEQKRIDSLADWMLDRFRKQPMELVGFLEAQNVKRFAVQITVDGLQQGLVEALVRSDQTQQSPFLKRIHELQASRQLLLPESEPSLVPEHSQQLKYLDRLANEVAPLDPYYLPFFKSLYLDYKNSIAETGIASTPTISVRNLPIIMTGAKVAGSGGTGIPNFHFVDRQVDRAYYFFGNDALQLDILMADNQVQTMFDRLRYLKTLSCNAQYDWQSQITYDGLVNLALGEGIRDFGERRCLRELKKRALVEVKLSAERTKLTEALASFARISWRTPFTRMSKRALIKQQIRELAKLAEGGMPDYVLMYIPWPDHFAHFTGPFSDEIIAPSGELNRLDYWLSQFASVYKDAGIDSQTLWGMAGDHGLAPVYYALNPELQVLANLKKDHNIDLSVVKISSDEGEGPKITNALNHPSLRDIDVVVASTAGGNFMLDFFNSPQGWGIQPVYRDLQDWRPLSQPEYSIDMIDEIATRLSETLDYLVVRENNCDLRACDIRLVAHRDGQRIDEVIQRVHDRIFYGSIAPENQARLLDIWRQNNFKTDLSSAQLEIKQHLISRCLIEADINKPATWCNETQWRQLTSLTPRPGSVTQLAHLYDSERAGTVNLFPRFGIGYNTIVPGRHAGEHYLEKDAMVAFWGKPVNTTLPLKTVENGSLAPTIFEYLTGETIVPGQDGWGYASVLPLLQAE